MEEARLDKRLSSQSYWDEVLAKAELPRINTRKAYHYKVTMDFIDPFLHSENYKTLLEIGCGSSGWLPYFAQQYKLKVSGLDYSAIGCRLAEENMRMLKINYGEIICQDLLAKDCTDGKKYDVIFSYGVVEHFDNPQKIIGIFASVLNPGGLIITLVPNLNGFMGRVSRKYVPDIFNIHRVMTAEELQQYHEANQLFNLRTAYAGTFTLDVVPLAKSNQFIGPNAMGKFKFFLISKTNRIITKLTSLLGINLPSKTFSPYIISVSKKSNDKTGE